MYQRTTTKSQISEVKAILQQMVENEKNLPFCSKLAEIRDAIDFLTLTKEFGTSFVDDEVVI